MDRDDIIECAVATDQNYFVGMLVTVYSIAKYASRDCTVRMHVLDGGIHEDSYKLMVEATHRVNKRVEFIRHMVEEIDYSAYPSWKGNRMTYVRFVLPTLLPDANYIVYADVDMLWRADIAKLWAQRKPELILQAVYDTFGAPIESRWFAKRNLPFHPENYFNNGLLIMNLSAFRKENMIGQAVKFLNEHTDVTYPDQTVFNAIMGHRVRLLDPDWNFVARDMANADKKEPFVLHYVAEATPWRTREYCGVVRPYLAAWLKEYAEASGENLISVYEKFGFKYRPAFDVVIMFIATHKWLRRALTIPLRMIGLCKISNFINGASSRCGKLVGSK